MSIDCFMKIEGVKGESQAAGHKDEIDVLSWFWGASRDVQVATWGTGEVRSGTIHDLRFSKPVDKSSPQLFQHVVHPPSKGLKATMICQKAGGAKPLPYLTITMEGVFITKLAISLHTGTNDPPTEEVTLNFAKVTIEHKEQNERGATGDVTTAQFDLANRSK